MSQEEKAQRIEAYRAYLEALSRWRCNGPLMAALRRALARLEQDGDDHV